MRKAMIRRILGLMLIAVLSAPSLSLAQRRQEEKEVYDARYEGYPTEVNVQKPGTSGAYFLWALLGVLALGVLFKDAKRTHLD